MNPGGWTIAVILSLVTAPVPIEDTVDGVLAAQQSAFQGTGLEALLQQERNNLAFARTIGEDPFAAARGLFAWQATTFGTEVKDVPVTPSDSLGQAINGLMTRYGEPPADAKALDALPPGAQAALMDVIDAYNAAYDAVQAAWANVETPLDTASAPKGLDQGLIIGAHETLMEATQVALDTLPSHWDFNKHTLTLDLGPVLVIDIGGHNTNHHRDAWVTIDLGGDDQYYNNAGGARSPWPGCVPTGPLDRIPVGYLLDVGGDDRYDQLTGGGGCGKNGGAYTGLGLLVDGGGRDTYIGTTHGVNGGGTIGGHGLLVDLGPGSDVYTARHGGTNGGGRTGVGALIDQEGDSTYQGPTGYVTGGVNGGGQSQGVGALIDLGGHDFYDGFGLGANGGADAEAVGFLYDRDGDDSYNGVLKGINGGGYRFSAGFLYDRAGDDYYYADHRATNGGAHTHAVGLLIDRGGNDVYVSGDDGVNGGGTAVGIGHLFDGAGDDTYTGGSLGVNGGGAAMGIGTLVDLSGMDTYTAGGLGTNGGSQPRPDCADGSFQKNVECTFSTNLGLHGFLYDGAGLGDTYRDHDGNYTDFSILPKGATGYMWDSDHAADPDEEALLDLGDPWLPPLPRPGQHIPPIDVPNAPVPIPEPLPTDVIELVPQHDISIPGGEIPVGTYPEPPATPGVPNAVPNPLKLLSNGVGALLSAASDLLASLVSTAKSL